ncbi:MAG: acetyl-CoA hydrolase/transferase C-terminal domain protein [Nevskia sp.]|nr:acetyl-CoA hydrolase/transferase C-terminal domain protein [Nevskia sp.]
MTARRFNDCEACVDAILQKLGKRIVLGTPLGIGKPNALLNALYRRAKADASISLDIITALSLNPPLGKSELEERVLKPIRARVWPDYPRLEYLDDVVARKVPANIRVIEFYVQSGAILHNASAQQNYISSNYTHVARDMLSRGVNLLLQAVSARDEDGVQRLSLSCNPDVTLQLEPMMQQLDYPWAAVAQINRDLPWMGNHAAIDADKFHFIVDNPALDHQPFAVPHNPVAAADWAIGLHASALVRDGGTLQVGIGALGDAVCHALRVRERDNASYRQMLSALGVGAHSDGIGGRDRFAIGLYVASELLSNPLFALFEDGIVRRRVYEDIEAQRRVDGVAHADEPGGAAMHGAFFIGPGDFYQRLRALPEDQRALIDMTSVAEVNRIYTHYELERLQRRHARFINICMKATLLGAAISDQLGDGQIVSGVGGQHDFVAMAHQLPEGRSILAFRATRSTGRKLESNVVWEFPHATIARHERDLFVTEYGIADLRGRTDRECCAAMLAIADSRCQPALLAAAQQAGKLPQEYRIPAAHCDNLPHKITQALQPHLASGALPKLPFGSDLNTAELALAERLGKLKAAAASTGGKLRLLRAFAVPASAEEARAALTHMQLDQPGNLRERLLARLVRAAYRL